MRVRAFGSWVSLMALLAACSADDRSDGGRRRTDSAVDGPLTEQDAGTPPEDGGGPPPCTDTDGDGISDTLESNGDDDGDGVPNHMDDDSDGDGFGDSVEATGNYPGYMSMRAPLTCGQSPDDCDMDGLGNNRDRDSDNDGLTDVEERMANTNPCRDDTDGDGISDLTEQVAMSNPTDRMSTPPAGSLYVTLPYHPPGEMGEHVHREFTFSTRLRSADIFFVVDTTGSMQLTIDNVRATLSSRIIPGIRMALGPMGDARYGVAGHGDFDHPPFGPSEYNHDGAIAIYQRLDPDGSLSQAAVGRLRACGGGDTPESQVPALHAVIAGSGLPQYGAGDAGCGPSGGVRVTRPMNPATDCGASAGGETPFGWGCFVPGRVPILVLFSDAPWHNMSGNEYSSAPGTPVYMQLVEEMVRRGAYFVGIDVGGGATYRNSQQLARATRTLDGSGNPIAFQDRADRVADLVVNAITTIAGQSRQDITTRVEPDAMERRLPMGRTTADFIKAVTPARGIPPAPMGYDRHDSRTFYNVAPSTQVVFDVDFYNDFQPGGSTAQLFRAKIVVLGRAMAPVDERQVYIIVPAAGAQPPG